MYIATMRWTCDTCGGGGRLPVNQVGSASYSQAGDVNHRDPQACRAVLQGRARELAAKERDFAALTTTTQPEDASA